jgi:hypothetical protein
VTWFGWLTVALYSLAIINKETSNQARALLLVLIFAIFLVGTGNGL